jgi:hypothetical protein
MEDGSASQNAQYEYLFHHLVAMFQTLALQQLGKLVNPITGRLERDLHQAKITIDMLQMLRSRTLGNLEQSERMILERALMELQMNYVDEAGRKEEPPPREEMEGMGDEQQMKREGGDSESQQPKPMKEGAPEKTPEAGKPSEASQSAKKRAASRAKGIKKNVRRKASKAKKNGTSK